MSYQLAGAARCQDRRRFVEGDYTLDVAPPGSVQEQPAEVIWLLRAGAINGTSHKPSLADPHHDGPPSRGSTKKEVTRVLKRYIARQVYPYVTAAV